VKDYTPRTQEVINLVADNGCTNLQPLFDHARQLERELSAALVQVKYGRQVGRSDFEWDTLRNENEALRAENVQLKNLNGQLNDAVDSLRAEVARLSARTCTHHNDAERAAAGCPVCARAEVERLQPSVKIAIEYQWHVDAVVALAKELGCDCGEFYTRLDFIRKRAREGAEIQRVNEVISWKARAEAAEAIVETANTAMLGLIVLADLYYERVGRDPYNNDNYCRAKDWINAAALAGKGAT